MTQGPLGSNGLLTSTGFRSGQRGGSLLDGWVSSAHGDKYNLAKGGFLAFAANPSGVTLSAALATTYVGIVLSNPIDSTKDLVVRNVSGLALVAPAAITALGLITGFNAGTNVTHTTPLTVRAAKYGDAATALVGKVDSAATLPTAPVWARQLSVGIAATGQPSFNVDLQGSIILPKGAYLAIGANIAGPASGFFGSIEWEEIAA